MVGYKLFIDDECLPHDNDADAVVVKSSAEAISYIAWNGMPSEIMFDHDLGGDDTTRKVLQWLSEWMDYQCVKFPKGFKWSVHSQNPVGRDYIDGFMKQLTSYIGYVK